jgi:hypothetical protein
MPTDRDPRAGAPDGLTAFQVEVAQLFFTLPESAGFLLAGGAALLAQHLIRRPTHDLDFFTSQDRGEVGAARAAFEVAVSERGWKVRHIRETPTFVRLVVSGAEDLVVDIALDAPPGRPPQISVAGPTFDPEELAGRKVIALFDRAEARDFADVYALSSRYDKALLLERAAEVDVASIAWSSLTCCAPSPGSPTTSCRCRPAR